MKLVLVAALVAAATGIVQGGCVPSVYRVEYDEVETTREPPPPRIEPVPPAPGSAWVWVDGYWYWTGLDYVWHAGYWALPPVVHHVWVPSGWVQWRDRYRYVPGRWAPPHRVPHHHYVPSRPSKPRHHRPH